MCTMHLASCNMPCASCILQYPMVFGFDSYYLAWPAAAFLMPWTRQRRTYTNSNEGIHAHANMDTTNRHATKMCPHDNRHTTHRREQTQELLAACLLLSVACNVHHVSCMYQLAIDNHNCHVRPGRRPYPLQWRSGRIHATVHVVAAGWRLFPQPGGSWPAAVSRPSKLPICSRIPIFLATASRLPSRTGRTCRAGYSSSLVSVQALQVS